MGAAIYGIPRYRTFTHLDATIEPERGIYPSTLWLCLLWTGYSASGAAARSDLRDCR